MFASDVLKQQLAPSGVLRAGINLSNSLLVSGTAADGSPQGISPNIANLVASTLGLPYELVCFDRPGNWPMPSIRISGTSAIPHLRLNAPKRWISVTPIS